MVKIKNGKMWASNVAFALPEDFNLYLEPTGCGVHLLEFSSDDGVIEDGRVYIDVEFIESEISAEEQMEEIIEVCDMEKEGNLFSVTRGKGTAIAGYYHSTGFKDHYEERYDFPVNKVGKSQVSICIYIMCKPHTELKQSIREVLKLPNVKAFLKSVEYY